MKYFRAIIAVALIVFSFEAAYSGEKEAQSKSILENLQKGGYVIYMRHPHTDKSTKDIDKKNLQNCATQRNLSDKGRGVAKQIGQAIRELKVKFDSVKTSEFCRARQVPALMGLKNAQTNSDLNHSGGLPEEEAKKRAEFLKKTFSTKVAKSNVLLIGHSPNMKDVDLEYLAVGFEPADMLVFKAGDKPSTFQMVARVTPNNWADWLKSQKAIK